MAHVSDTVLVLGDGPTGLSCALFLAKNGVGVHVLGMDETPVNKALLHNYLGLDGVPGPTFMEGARGHMQRYGAKLNRQKVEGAERRGDGFRVRTAEGNAFDGRYLVLAHGRDLGLATSLGCRIGGDGVEVDHWGRTGVERLYAGGWQARGHKTQVAISVGDGAAIALDILSREKGKPVHDFDVLPPDAARQPKPIAR